MDKQVQSIIEDLLPLYNEGLLSEETTVWLEQQVKQSAELQKLVTLTTTPLVKEKIETPFQHDKMLKNIQRRLSLYQLLFVGISFYLAINTSILNESFGFVLWYTVLGLVTYLFYKDMKIVLYLSVLPIFIWSAGSNATDYLNGEIDNTVTLVQFILQSIMGSLLLSVIHYVFALIGSMMGLLLIKIRAQGEEK
ncbi:hypothetical protein ACLM5H_03210 [Fredinandcohnia humi]